MKMANPPITQFLLFRPIYPSNLHDIFFPGVSMINIAYFPTPRKTVDVMDKNMVVGGFVIFRNIPGPEYSIRLGGDRFSFLSWHLPAPAI